MSGSGMVFAGVNRCCIQNLYTNVYSGRQQVGKENRKLHLTKAFGISKPVLYDMDEL